MLFKHSLDVVILSTDIFLTVSTEHLMMLLDVREEGSKHWKNEVREADPFYKRNVLLAGRQHEEKVFHPFIFLGKRRFGRSLRLRGVLRSLNCVFQLDGRQAPSPNLWEPPPHTRAVGRPGRKNQVKTRERLEAEGRGAQSACVCPAQRGTCGAQALYKDKLKGAGPPEQGLLLTDGLGRRRLQWGFAV